MSGYSSEEDATAYFGGRSWAERGPNRWTDDEKGRSHNASRRSASGLEPANAPALLTGELANAPTAHFSAFRWPYSAWKARVGSLARVATVKFSA
jgi:hypothetical protein